MAWNRPNSGEAESFPLQRKGGSSTFLKRKGFPVLVCVSVVLCVGIAAWFCWPQSGDSDATKETVRRSIREATPHVTKPKKVRTKPIKTRDVTEAVRNVGEFEPPEIPKAAEPVYIDRFTNRYFKTSVEQVMGWVFTCKPGMMPPPLPAFSDEDYDQLASILISKCEIKESDDEKAVEAKESVDFAKKEMMKYIREGGDPQEFMNYYHKFLHEASDYRDLVVDQAQKIYEEDPKLAEDFLKEVNAKLDDKGIVRVEMKDIED